MKNPTGRVAAAPQRAGLAVATLMLMAGCYGNRGHTPSFYLIDHAAVLRPVIAENQPPLPYRVRVRDLDFPRVIDRNRIIYRYSPNQINYFRYQQWAIPPRTMLSDTIAHHVGASGVFAEVRRNYLDQAPDFEISGALSALERLESGDFGAAHLALRLELIDRSTGRVLVAHEFDRQPHLSSSSMTFFAQTVSRILEEETTRFLAKVWRHFGVIATMPPIHALERPDDAPGDGPGSGYRIVPLPEEPQPSPAEATP